MRRGVLAGAAAALAALTGCSTPHLSNGSIGGCFRALPAAEGALHGDKGRLLGVHRVPADRLPARVKAVLPPEDDALVCAVAFKGTFAAGTVTDARSTVSGSYAVVLVDARHLTVVSSLIADHLPKGLAGHLIS